MIQHDRVQQGGIVAVRLRPVKRVKNLKKLWGVVRSLCHDRDGVIRCCEAKIPVVPRLHHEGMEEVILQCRRLGGQAPRVLPLSGRV